MRINHLLRTIYHKIIFILNFKAFNEYQYAPIDIFKPLPLSSGSKLKRLIDDLTNNQDLIIRISDGTLLGLFRDGRLIPHDNDIDFDVEWSRESEKIIKSIAKKNSWKIIRKVSYCKKLQQLTYFDEEKVIFDFIFWSTDARFAINFSEPGHFRVMHSKYLLDLVKKNIGEFNYLIPRDSEEWLIYRYGKNWNIPQLSKKDWKDDCGDLGRAWWL